MYKEILTTKNKLADAFEEWDRRYRNNPDDFMNEAKRLLNETPFTYGKAAAMYLIEMLSCQENK